MSILQLISVAGVICSLYTVFIILLRLRKGIRRREIMSLGGVFVGAALISLSLTLTEPSLLLWKSALVISFLLSTIYSLTVTERSDHLFYFLTMPMPLLTYLFLQIAGPSFSGFRGNLIFLAGFAPGLVVHFIIAFRYWRTWRSRVHLRLIIQLPLYLFGAVAEFLYWRLVGQPFGITSILVILFAVNGTHLVLRGGYLSHRSWKEFARQFNPSKDSLTERFIHLARANTQSVLVLTQTIEAKDPYTRGHCIRVRDYSRAIARELGFDREHHMNLEFGSILHDVGKIGIAGFILNKQDLLTPDEFEHIKKHPEIGASIIGNVDSFVPVIPIVLHHHERFDGGGYPMGLAGDQIPLEARILAVADAYDAMTTDRPYRDAIPRDKALHVLQDCAGSQLDPDIVNCFVQNRIYDIPHNIQDRIAFEF